MPPDADIVAQRTELVLRLSEDALDRSLVEHLRCVESAADHSSSR